MYLYNGVEKEYLVNIVVNSSPQHFALCFMVDNGRGQKIPVGLHQVFTRCSWKIFSKALIFYRHSCFTDIADNTSGDYGPRSLRVIVQLPLCSSGLFDYRSQDHLFPTKGDLVCCPRSRYLVRNLVFFPFYNNGSNS